jgi:predicted membrane chloride channel (bestrophin family)
MVRRGVAHVLLLSVALLLDGADGFLGGSALPKVLRLQQGLYATSPQQRSHNYSDRGRKTFFERMPRLNMQNNAVKQSDGIPRHLAPPVGTGIDELAAAVNIASAKDVQRTAELPHQHIIQPPNRKNSRHWWLNLLSLPSSRTLFEIRSHLSANIVVACLVYLHMRLFPQNLLWLVQGLGSSRVHSLVSSALGLLLVFRTRSAYDRFLEARKLWGDVICSLRTMSRMAHSSLQGWDREHLLQLLAAYPPILLQHLRSGRVVTGREKRLAPRVNKFELEKEKEALLSLLPASDVEVIWRSHNRPLTVLKMMAAIVKSVLTDVNRVLLNYPHAGEAGQDLTRIEVNMIMTNVKADRSLSEKSIESLTMTLSNCERIVKTSIPLSYSKHTSRFLSVWCFSLPLVLIEQLSWRMIPAVTIICWALLSIEEVSP